MENIIKKCLVWVLTVCIITASFQVSVGAESLENILQSVNDSVIQVQQSVDAAEQTADEIDQAMGSWNLGSQKGITTFATPKAPSNTIGKGVDISKWNWKPNRNKDIDFAKLSKSVDFVIIRCFDASSSSNDAFFEKSIQECEKYGIPYGVYEFSRATTESAAKSEADRIIAALKAAGADPDLPVFLDMEAEAQGAIGAANLAKVAKKFCETVEAAGYRTGIYANKSWFTTKLTNSYFDTKIKWVAQYNTTCDYTKEYAMWQCTDSASVDGITGIVDLNYMVQDIYRKKLEEQDAEIEVSAQGYSGTYDGKAHSITVADYKEDTKVQYSTDNKNWSEKKPTRTSAGTTTVYYKATSKNGSKVSGSAKITIAAKKVSACTYSSVANQTYTGNQLKPLVTVKNSSTTLKSGTDYTITYGTNKLPGAATIKITGKGNYTGTKTIIFYILPKKVTGVVSAKGIKAKSAVLKWTKVTGATGYQIAYSRKGQNKWSYVTVTQNTKTFINLVMKSYDVKIRAYKTVDGVKKYGAFNEVKIMTAK
jgi:GH25 family lysozyme M1 (1,4-beta-N-acetylmuramidase)